ncbi:transcription factor DIVARICATA [Cucumis melo var. makuwa]|uniref:Transcription factor DIVARICATA n=2 Tax=Cucumis melo TaxID=3656 RepID=A0A5A7T3H8_CUCMM|nr:transcription factor DIVARICATA [Cucumis melo var. makuwa]TYJ97559.1 transcription factor DIVARICATA [Cucumis melo var. makuwa]
METLYPSSHLSSSAWFVLDNPSTKWTKEENKMFESALAIYDKETPDRWFKVAAMIPGKTVSDVIKQYKELEEDVCEIEAGRFPIPGYDLASSFSFEFVDDRNFDVYRRKSSVGRGSDHERKKGVPWTEEEHKQFLRGLLKYGKGDWRNISRNFVNSKTPTQVASHAQKYFMRQLSGGKDKRRPSIHDITTVNLTEPTASENEKLSSMDQFSKLPSLQKSPCYQKLLFDWNRSNNGGFLGLGSNYGDRLVSFPSGIAANGIKNEQDHELNSAYYGTYSKPHKSIFQFEPSRYQIYG